MFWENFYSLCIDRNTKPLRVVNELGIASGSITKWKNGTIPNQKTLQKISGYFDVSVEYFFLSHEKKPTAEAVGKDHQLLEEAEQLMGTLSPARQEEAMRYLRYLASQEGKDTP